LSHVLRLISYKFYVKHFTMDLQGPGVSSQWSVASELILSIVLLHYCTPIVRSFHLSFFHPHSSAL
jgi:hypothetical protein